MKETLRLLRLIILRTDVCFGSDVQVVREDNGVRVVMEADGNLKDLTLRKAKLRSCVLGNHTPTCNANSASHGLCTQPGWEHKVHVTMLFTLHTLYCKTRSPAL